LSQGMADILGPGDGDNGPPSPSSSSVGGLPARGSRHLQAVEVETELEDNGEEEPDRNGQTLLLAEEVEEQLDAPETARGSVQAQTPQNGYPPAAERNVEVWRSFGCDTEAGRLLRKLYKGADPKHASSKVSYPRLPSPAQRWEPQVRKPAPKKAVVQVPRSAAPTRDRDDPRYWPAPPVPCRRPAREILAELEVEHNRMRRAGAPPNMRKGRDQDGEKQGLQERFRYCGGRAMPPGAMGHVPEGELPPSGLVAKAAAARSDRKQIDADGFNAEHREIFEELCLAVRHKQQRIAEIDGQEKNDPRPSKAKTALNREALELRNQIDRDLKDIDKLLELTEHQR